MSAPVPVAGTNPYQGTYQVEQFDTTVPPAKSPIDVLSSPPAAGIAAEPSPANAFEARDWQNSHPGWTGIP